MRFDDNKGIPTTESREYTGLLKLGRASVYFSWTVTVNKETIPSEDVYGYADGEWAAQMDALEAAGRPMNVIKTRR